jgi:hypothetical protein
MIERRLDLELNDSSAILLSLLNFTTAFSLHWLVSLRMWRLTDDCGARSARASERGDQLLAAQPELNISEILSTHS